MEDSSINTSNLFGPGVSSLWVKRQRKTRTGLTDGTKLPIEIVKLLGEAEQNYIIGNYSSAINILSEVIKLAPQHPDAYHISALIYESVGDKRNALQLYVLAAFFTTTKRIDVWIKVVELAFNIREWSQCLEAIDHCLKTSQKSYFYEIKIRVLIKLNQFQRVKEVVKPLLTKTPKFYQFLIEICDELHDKQEMKLALIWYLMYIVYYTGTTIVPKSLLTHFFIDTIHEAQDVETIVQQIAYIHHALRKVIDILLDSTVVPLSVVIQLLDNLLDLTQQLNTLLSSAEAPTQGIITFPNDLSLLYGIIKLNSSNEVEIDQALSILNPILLKLDHADYSSLQSNHMPIEKFSHDATLDNDIIIKDFSETVDNVEEVEDEQTEDKFQSMVLSTSEQRNKMKHNFDYEIFLLRQRIRIAFQFHRIGMITRCTKVLESVIKKLPDIQEEMTPQGLNPFEASKLYKELGKLHNELLDHESAFQFLQVAIQIDHYDWDLLAWLAKTGLKLNETERIEANDGYVRYMDKVLEWSTKHEKSNKDIHAEGQDELIQLKGDKLQRLDEVEGKKKSSKRIRGWNESDEAALSSSQQLESTDDFNLNQSSLVSSMTKNPPDSQYDEDIELMESIMKEYDNRMNPPPPTDHPKPSPEDVMPSDKIEEKLEEDDHFVTEFDRDDLKEIIHSFVQWAELSWQLSYYSSFYAIVMPIIQSWHYYGFGYHGKSNASLQWSISQYHHPKSSNPSHYFQPRIHKRYITLSDIISTRRAQSCESIEILNKSQNVCFVFMTGLCDFIPLNKFFSSDELLDLSNKLSQLIQEDHLSLHFTKEMASDVMNQSMILVLQSAHHKALSKSSHGKSKVKRYLMEQHQSDTVHDALSQPTIVSQSEISDGLRLKPNTSSMKDDDPTNVQEVMKGSSHLEPFVILAKEISENLSSVASRLLMQPDDTELANQLFRVVHLETHNGLEKELPLRRLFINQPNCKISKLLAGHQMAIMRKHPTAINEYLDAFKLDPNQPLVSLILGTYLIMMSGHPLVKERYESLLKGMIFLCHYSSVRRSLPTLNHTMESHGDVHYITNSALCQETWYNLGRAYQEIRLNHLAVACYQKSLEIADQLKGSKVWSNDSIQVTLHTAHNLILLYKKSQSVQLVLEIMTKYLVF